MLKRLNYFALKYLEEHLNGKTLPSSQTAYTKLAEHYERILKYKEFIFTLKLFKQFKFTQDGIAFLWLYNNNVHSP